MDTTGATLGLSGIRYQAFGPNPDPVPLDGLGGMFSERFTAYPLPPGRDPVPGNRNAFAPMSADLIGGLCPDGVPDLVVIAHAVPDGEPRMSATGYLQERLGGQPLIFAVSDQGRVAPFTALRLASDCLRHDGRRRAVVIAADQATLTYDDPGFGHLDADADHAVGLLLTLNGPIGLTGPEHRPGTDAGQIREVLSGAVARAAAELGGPVTVVAAASVSASLAGLAPAGLRVVTAPGDRLCTAVWSALAAELAAPADAARTVLAADYEPALRYLCLATFRVPAGRECP